MITSRGNTKIRNLVALKKKASERNTQDVFLVEGIKMFREVPEDQLLEVYASESFLKNEEGRESVENKAGRLYEQVSDDVYALLSDTRTPQGIMAVVRQKHYSFNELLGGGSRQPLLMVLENLQDPGNLGTIVRTAEGAGVTGILMSRGTADLMNPKVTRSTMGSIFRMPYLYTDDLGGDILRLKEKGIMVCAAHLGGEEAYDKGDYRRGTAFLIGNESRGLSDETADLADLLVRIPMQGHVESLNASVAAAILMYEADRQRRRN